MALRMLESIQDVLTGRHRAWEPDWRVPPGEILLDWLAERHVLPSKLAIVAGLSSETVMRLIQGEEPLTEMIALRLERATKIPQYVWLRLEEAYRR